MDNCPHCTSNKTAEGVRLNVFSMYMGAYTQISAAVFMTMRVWGGVSEHTQLFVCISRAHSPKWPHILEQEKNG